MDIRQSRAGWWVLCLVVACGRPPSPQNAIVTSISGRVLDQATGQPIANALVQTEPFVKQVSTTAEGLYTIESGLAVGESYRVSASKTGFESNSVTIASIVEGQNTVADLSLSPEGPKLTVSTTAVQVNAGSSAGTFRVGNGGDKTKALSFNVTSTDAFISQVSPNSGSVTASEQTVTVSINRAALPAGTSPVTATLDVTSNGGSAAVVVTVIR